MSQLATGKAATLIKLAFAAGAKVSAAFVAFGLTALVTRNLPGDEAGLFLLGFSLLAVLSVFFRLGLDNVVLRFLSAHGADDFAQEKLNRGLLWIASATVPATLLGMTLSQPIATYVFNKPAFGPVLLWMLPALPAMALFFLLSMAFQSQHRVVLATLFQNLGISALFIIGFGAIWLADHNALQLLTAARIYSAAAIMMLLLGLWLWFRRPGMQFKRVAYRDHELSQASKNLWMASCMSLAVQWSGVLIAGAMVPADELAHLSAAQRTAMLTSFILMVVNMVVAPRYARLWKEGNIDKIRYLAKWSTRAMVAMVLPVVAVMMIFPERIMGLFGTGYEQAAVLLMILAAGQFVNVATGSVGYLLNMSGHEKDFNRVTLFSGPLTIVLALVLTQLYGALGAAIAMAVGVAVQNLLAVALVKKRLGFVTTI